MFLDIKKAAFLKIKKNQIGNNGFFEKKSKKVENLEEIKKVSFFANRKQLQILIKNLWLFIKKPMVFILKT